MAETALRTDLLFPALHRAMKAAGRVILDIYHGTDDWEVETKSDASPLTRADREANKVICAALAELDFQAPIISEENREVPWATRSQWEWCWLVDPLDGTKEFIKRNGEFTINVALVHEGRSVLGVVYAPVLDELYWAAAGQGAWMDAGEGPMRLQAPRFRKDQAGLRVVCSRSHLNDETRAFVEQFEAPELISRGSAFKFLMVARGEAHVYPRLAPTMEWDTAAAQIILEEAGGKVLEYESGQPLRYNKENLRNPWFVAWGDVIE